MDQESVEKRKYRRLAVRIVQRCGIEGFGILENASEGMRF
jgi:hypothetical protein